MEHCQYENEIKRIAKLLDGNGRSGLTRDVVELKEGRKQMCAEIQELKETAKYQATAMNAFASYQAKNQTLDDYKREERKMRRQLLIFAITQSIAIIGLVIKIFFG